MYSSNPLTVLSRGCAIQRTMKGHSSTQLNIDHQLSSARPPVECNILDIGYKFSLAGLGRMGRFAFLKGVDVFMRGLWKIAWMNVVGYHGTFNVHSRSCMTVGTSFHPPSFLGIVDAHFCHRRLTRAGKIFKSPNDS